MALGGLMDKAKAATADAASGAKEKAVETTQNTIAEIKGLEPVLRNSGFIVGDVKVTLSIPPGVTVVIEQIPSSQESLDDLVAKVEELSKLQGAIIKGLKEAYAMEDSVNEHGMTIGQIEMELTFPPKVHVHLNSQDSRAFG